MKDRAIYQVPAAHMLGSSATSSCFVSLILGRGSEKGYELICYGLCVMNDFMMQSLRLSYSERILLIIFAL